MDALARAGKLRADQVIQAVQPKGGITLVQAQQPAFQLFFCPANRVWGHNSRKFRAENVDGERTHLNVDYCNENIRKVYLADIDQQTQDMFLQLVEQMAEREGVTEKLKAEDQMRWVGLMNNIAERAREIVNAEIIYSGTSAINVPTHTEYKEPPKIFWKYYDLYRRKKISLHEYAIATGLSAFVIRHYLHDVVENSPKIIENPKQI